MTASHKINNSEDFSSSEAQKNTNKRSEGGSPKKEMKKEKETQKKKIRDEKEENTSENLILELKNKLAATEKEIRAQKEKYIRSLAELENVRRRSEREKADIGKYCFEAFFTDLLPVLDSFDKALSKREEEVEKESAVNSFYTGIQLVSKQLIQNLEKNGLSQVKSLGEKFDPECHQAIQKNESSKVKEETVSEEYAKGYMLNGRLLRPAMVSVSVPTP